MRTIAQRFETGEQTSQKGHFRNLVLIARFDGKVEETEKKLLQNIASKLSLTNEQVSEILEHPENYPVIPPSNREERYERFIQLIQMAMVDGVLTKEEENYVNHIGISLGFTQESVHEKADIIISKVKAGISRDQILEGLL